ncbi:hypothetical protein KIW84_075487 [Lathyrus oleraceus]|uniref:Protein FAR1-RELATED SEQUENCE n=1 Tax=Pisum sativum TaxID=3888 RepID=A0A9D4VWK6_PEA|nr:hypothetical protein KIW84_075487 [Pisum sativum]
MRNHDRYKNRSKIQNSETVNKHRKGNQIHWDRSKLKQNLGEVFNHTPGTRLVNDNPVPGSCLFVQQRDPSRIAMIGGFDLTVLTPIVDHVTDGEPNPALLASQMDLAQTVIYKHTLLSKTSQSICVSGYHFGSISIVHNGEGIDLYEASLKKLVLMMLLEDHQSGVGGQIHNGHEPMSSINFDPPKGTLLRKSRGSVLRSNLRKKSNCRKHRRLQYAWHSLLSWKSLPVYCVLGHPILSLGFWKIASINEMENLPKICVDTTDAFMTTERFGTREEVIRWIKEVEIDNKVTVIISRSDTETGKRGRSNKIIFGCDKGGKHKISDSGTQSASKKCGCPFKIRSTPAKDGSGWKIDVKCGLHNHGLPDRLEGHSFIGRLTTDEKQHVADLAKRHVAPRNILLSLQDKFPENVTRITQVYKHKSVIEKDIRGPRSEIQHLFKLIEDAGYVYWSRKKDDSEVVREIFWAHPDSVKLLNIFPIVLVMDITYKTNKYR